MTHETMPTLLNNGDGYGDLSVKWKRLLLATLTNSVVVIRVKFTEKPGKQHLVRREACRRFTEILNTKGIYFALRRIIVVFRMNRNEKPSMKVR